MIFFNFSKTEGNTTSSPWTLWNHVHDSSYVWRFSHENDHRPSLWFLVGNMSHKTTLCAGFIFFDFFKLMVLIWPRSCQLGFFHENDHRPSLVFFLVSLSYKTTNGEGFIFFDFFKISYAQSKPLKPRWPAQNPSKPRGVSPNPSSQRQPSNHTLVPSDNRLIWPSRRN